MVDNPSDLDHALPDAIQVSRCANTQRLRILDKAYDIFCLVCLNRHIYQKPCTVTCLVNGSSDTAAWYCVSLHSLLEHTFG